MASTLNLSTVDQPSDRGITRVARAEIFGQPMSDWEEIEHFCLQYCETWLQLEQSSVGGRHTPTLVRTLHHGKSPTSHPKASCVILFRFNGLLDLRSDYSFRHAGQERGAQ